MPIRALGGIGNMVNCGAAMYASPVGIVNACDPGGAYREAIEIFSAHQWSYGLEAAGVMAACVAEALRPGATRGEHRGDRARGGQGRNERGDRRGRLRGAVARRLARRHCRRCAMRSARLTAAPKTGCASGATGRTTGSRAAASQLKRCRSRLGFLVVAKGDFEKAVLGAANYGRDNDSIAGMAGAMAGALHGDSVIRPDWIARVNSANRCDLDPLAADLAAPGRHSPAGAICLCSGTGEGVCGIGCRRR